MIRATLKFLRLKILVTCYALVFLGSAVAGATTLKAVLSILILATWYIHAASSNDYADRHIDKINLKSAGDRPLVSGDISVKQLWILHYSAGLAVLLLSYFYGINVLLLTSLVLAIDYAYSLKPVRLSDKGIVSQLILPVAYVYFPFSIGFWSAGTHAAYPWAISIGLYCGFVARLLLKDFRDVIGDKKYGKMTFLLRHGQRVTCQLSAFFSVTALTILLFATHPPQAITYVLLVGQLDVLIFLGILSHTQKMSDQKTLITLVAKVANALVLVFLAYFLAMNVGKLSSTETEWIPALLGAIMLISIWWSFLDVQHSAKYRLSFTFPSFFQHLAWILMRIFLSIFCSLKIINQHYADNIQGSFIVAANHSSELDPLVIISSLPFFSPQLPLTFVSRGKSFYINSKLSFLYGGALFRMMGALPAYVGLNNYKQALTHHLDAINKGDSICIFPIGKKHPLNEISNARGGVSFLAQESNLPILPILVEGLGKYTFYDYIKGKCRVTITFGEPVRSADIFIKKKKLSSKASHYDHEVASVRLMSRITNLSRTK